MHSFGVYILENVQMARSLESSGDSFMYLTVFVLFCFVLFFCFVFYRSLPNQDRSMLDKISNSIDMVLYLSLSTFSCKDPCVGNFNAHHVKSFHHSNTTHVAVIQT